MNSTDAPPKTTSSPATSRPSPARAGFGLKDDAACLTPKPGHDLVLTVDALVERIHFLPEDPPGSIARKALGVNVSDLAAKGADPAGFLLSLALARRLDRELARRFRGRSRERRPGISPARSSAAIP